MTRREKISDKLIDITPAFVFRIYHFFRDLFYNLKWAWQRAMHGYCDKDWFDLPDWFMGTMPKLLYRLKKYGNSYPIGFESKEEWNEVLNEMQICLSKMDLDGEYNQVTIDGNVVESWQKTYENCSQYKERFFELFNKYFYYLWD